MLDHNLSPKLAKALGDVFGRVDHVDNLGMDQKSDTFLWDYAKKEGYSIVTKDKDFYQRSALLGAPPKIIHLTMGNCGVKETASALLDRKGHVLEFLKHVTKAYLTLP
ncbi:MAG: DUF5615 family PIN-like protein [Luteolibacter sp.]|nr:DUF5615 family PIN-like protein [Verrucomicrobiota bacterium]